MGEAKRRKPLRARFLSAHPKCVYCGGDASTVDHCPPRCFFLDRHGPEDFEYPSCHRCNDVSRLDEQALSVMVRVRIDGSLTERELEQYGQSVRGVANNQPDLVREWQSEGASARKRTFREMFGREAGDFLRLSGYGGMKIGPLTEALIERFMVRLGQSLYYKHVGRIFNGAMFVRHVSLLEARNAKQYIEAALSIAPHVADVARAGKPLHAQFTYRYNFGDKPSFFYAAVRFSDQFIFQLFGVERDGTLDDHFTVTGHMGHRADIRTA